MAIPFIDRMHLAAHMAVANRSSLSLRWCRLFIRFGAKDLDCLPKTPCGVWMLGGPCLRAVGHCGDHRSRTED